MTVNDLIDEPLATLNRRLNPICAQIWLSETQAQFGVLVGYKYATIENLAIRFPTSETLRRYKFGEEEYLHRMNIQYLTRVQRGERGMKDLGLAKRVENDLFVDSNTLRSSLCAILKKPELRKQEFKKMISSISPKLKGRIFKASKSEEEIKQRCCYWSYENLFLINSQDFLTYQLLLLRKAKFNHTSLQSNLSIAKLVLLFWRVLLTTRFGEHSDTLCEAFFRYLKTNLPPELIPPLPKELNHFEMLRNIAFPHIVKYPTYTSSFTKYKLHNQEMCKKAASNFFPDYKLFTDTAFYAEIIYWADRYVKRWIDGEIDKTTLFNRESKEYREIALGMHFSSRHRIW